jgi:hypothetical protein
VKTLSPNAFKRLLSRVAFCHMPLLLFAGFFEPSLSQAQSLSSLSISPNQPTVDIGGTAQLTATATYSN